MHCGALRGRRNVAVTGRGGFGRAMGSLFGKVSDFVSTGAIMKRTVRMNSAVVLPLVSMSFNMNTNTFSKRGGSGNNNKVTKGVAPYTILIVRGKAAGLIGIGGRSNLAGVLSVIPSFMSHFASKGSSRRSINRSRGWFLREL